MRDELDDRTEDRPRAVATAASPTAIPFWLAFLFLVFAAMSWAGSGVAGRAASGNMPPFTLSFVRWLLVALCFMLLGWRQNWLQRHLILRHWAILTAFGFFGVVGFTVPYYVGLQYTVAVNASLMNASGTVWIVIITFLMTGETVTRRQGFGIVLGLVGTIVIVLRADPSQLGEFTVNIGDPLVLVAFFAWAVYTVILRWRPKDLGEIPFLTGLTFFGTLTMLPLWLWDVAQGRSFALTVGNCVIVGYAVIFPSFLAYIVWNKAVPVVGPGIAGMAQYMVPVFGTVFAVAILGESVQTYHIVGIAIIFTGVWLVTSGRRRTAATARARAAASAEKEG